MRPSTHYHVFTQIVYLGIYKVDTRLSGFENRVSWRLHHFVGTLNSRYENSEVHWLCMAERGMRRLIAQVTINILSIL
jgi:hypothetical protein